MWLVVSGFFLDRLGACSKGGLVTWCWRIPPYLKLERLSDCLFRFSICVLGWKYCLRGVREDGMADQLSTALARGGMDVS